MLTLINDADCVRAFGFLQIIRRQENCRAAFALHLLNIFPEVASAGGVQANGWLVQEEHLRLANQTADDLEFALHAAGVGLHRIEKFVADAKQVGQLPQLLFLCTRHQSISRPIGM